jgi:hypothetical protein
MDMADWFSLLQSISICLLLITPPLLILLGFDYTQYMYVCLFCMSCRHNGIGEERIHQGTGCLTCFTSADAYTREATRTYDCVPSTNISPRVGSSCHNMTFLHNSARRGLSSNLPAVDWPMRIYRRALVRPRHPPRSGTRRASDCATRQPALADWHSPTGSHRLALSRRLVHTDWFTPTGSRRLAYAD